MERCGDRVKRRTKAAGLEGENLMARAEGEEQMSVEDVCGRTSR
jgi:hypothetical protein